jgi:uncharacterized protein
VPQDRLPAIDAARGFAFLGVAVVNAHTFNGGFNSGNYAWNLAVHWADQAAELISNLVFAHRAIPLLAFLLGVGLVVQTRGIARERIAQALHARYLALLVIGVAHGFLVWPGEILTAYALMVLLMMRYAVAWRPKELDHLLCVFLTLSFAVALYGAATEHRALVCKRDDLFSAISFAQTTWFAERLAGVKEFLMMGFTHVLGVWIWAFMLFGVWCARTEAFWEHLKRPRFSHPVVFASGVMLVLSTAVELKTGLGGAWSSLFCEGATAKQFSLAENATMFASVPILLTLFAALANVAAEQRWFLRLQAVGRAPLTMFLSQSVVFSVLFSHHLFGLHGRIGRAGVFVIAVLTYLALAAWIDQCYVQRGLTPPGERLSRALSSRFAKRFPVTDP